MAFRDAEDADLDRLAQIELGRASDVADVFDEQQIECVEIEFTQAAFHQRRFEMARAAGEQLHDWHVQLGNAVGIARGGDVAFEHSDSIVALENVG